MDKNKRLSFTLIELLVVSMIILLLSGASIAMFGTYKTDRVLASQISHFTQSIQLAKSKAIASDASQCSNSSTAYVNGYTVQVDPSSIKIVPNCNTVPSPIIKIIDPQIVFVTPTFSLSFNVHNYDGKTICIPIKNATNTVCKFVKIDESGLVTQGNCSSCSPIACPCP